MISRSDRSDSLYAGDDVAARDYGPDGVVDVRPSSRQYPRPRRRRWTGILCPVCGERRTMVALECPAGRRAECMKCFEYYVRSGGRRW